MRAYEFDRHIFNRELSSAAAWMIGWILSDGGVYNNRLTISLSSVDKEVMEKFKNTINFKGKIRDSIINKGDKIIYKSSISIYNKQLIEDLKKYGIVPNKSLIVEFPINIEWKNIRHFIRGYFEGDGSVKYNKNRNCLCINFKGTEKFLRKLKFKLRSCIEVKGCIYKDSRSNIFNYEITGNRSAVNFLNFIYSDISEENRLERKYNRAIELYNIVNNKRKIPTDILLAFQ